MKKIIFLFLAFATFNLKAQNYTPIINYAFNGTPTNGIKINTNIPFQHGYGMPTLIIEGYDYGGNSPIGLILNWYVYNDTFVKHSVSSFGNYTPEIKLYNENDKIVIFINDKRYFNRFTIRGFAKGKYEKDSDFEGWTITDEVPIGTYETVMNYRNKFAGHISFTGNALLPNGIWNIDGNVGIGTSTPLAKLHVNNGDNSYGSILANASEQNFSLYTKTLTTSPINTESFRLGLKYSTIEDNGYISFYRGTSSSGGFLGFSTNGIERMRIHKDGNIGIGTTDTKGFKLGVNGKIAATEVKIATYTNWSDFVFEKNYELPSLENVEQHIKEKGHLQDIPSAKEVEKNGFFLGEMDAKLLQKIEELMLYTIQQEKEIKELKKQNSKINKQQKEIEELKTLVNQLLKAKN